MLELASVSSGGTLPAFRWGVGECSSRAYSGCRGPLPRAVGWDGDDEDEELFDDEDVDLEDDEEELEEEEFFDDDEEALDDDEEVEGDASFEDDEV